MFAQRLQTLFLRLYAVLFLLLPGVGVAATYTLPAAFGSAPFTNCAWNAGLGTATCSGDLAIGSDETVIFAANMTLSADGSITVGNDSNFVGTGYTVNVVADGNITVGARLVGSVNFTSGGIFTAGDNVAITGNITAGGGMSLGTGSTVIGVCTPTHPQCYVLQLAKVANASSAVLADVVSFAITATNPGTRTFTNTVVTDVLPAGMTYSAHSASLGTAVVTGQTVTWTIPSLPAGGSAQLTLAAKLTQTGVLTNTVTSPSATSASANVLVLATAVTHFRFDEPAGTWSGAAGEVLDSGGTALHGRRRTTSTPTTTNAVLPSPLIGPPAQAGVVGQFCNAGQFDGKAAVEVGASSLFDYTTQLSATTWIYPTAAPTGGNLYSILSNDQNYEFHLNSSRKLYWWWGGGTKQMTSTGTIPLNQWTHIAITSDSSPTGGRQRIYINGVLDTAVNTWKGTRTPNGCNFYIGGDVSTRSGCPLMPERNFRGMIDEAKLYSYELSAAEVVADMNLGRSCSGTFDHIRIEHDGSGSVCNAETVTVKACLNSSCSSLYAGNVTVRLSPAGWVGGDTFTLSGGLATRQLSIGTAGNVTLGLLSATPSPSSPPRCLKGGTETCVMSFASASCSFDAAETGANPQTRLLTKLAGTAFNIDLLALSSATTINPAYSGIVTADLVDASVSTCPSAYPGLTAETSVTFAGEGRKALTFNYAGAAPHVRVRARVGTGTPACSYDNFSIRPAVFAVTSTDATNNAASGTPVIKAGANFNLTAAALNLANGTVIGYTGTPTIDTTNTKVTGTPVAGVLAGSFNAGAAATGVADATTTYSEVGNFGLAANAVEDTTFTAVDQPDDCSNDYSNTEVGNKYGCKTGSSAVPQTIGTSGFGRFIPDQFVLSAVNVTACNGFNYMDKTFPVSFTLTAVNQAGATTANYTGTYAKLDPTNAALWLPATLGSTGIALGARNDTADLSTRLVVTGTPIGNWVSGVANISADLTFSRLTAAPPDGAYEALDIGIAPRDADGTTLQAAMLDLDVNNDSVAERRRLARSKARFGRLRMSNAFGSVAPLQMPVETQYWTGRSWVKNTDDTCTSLAAIPFTYDPVGWPAPTAGTGFITIAPPGVGSRKLIANLAGLPWLRSKWAGSAGYDQDPSALATIGIYSPEHKRTILIREGF